MPATAAELDALLMRLRARMGLTGSPVSRLIEAGALAKFARATGQTDPRLLDPDRPGGIEAAPTYLSTFCADAMSDLLVLDGLPFAMFLHTGDAVELVEPIRAGDRITAVARYADAFVRPGRAGPMLFQLLDMTLTNQLGRVAATVRVTMASFDPPAAHG